VIYPKKDPKSPLFFMKKDKKKNKIKENEEFVSLKNYGGQNIEKYPRHCSKSVIRLNNL
jgi:hypothetical protein